MPANKTEVFASTSWPSPTSNLGMQKRLAMLQRWASSWSYTLTTFRDGSSAQDILYEILLKSGFPLTTPVETLTLAGKTVYSVAGGALFICLDRDLTLELIRTIAEQKPERVVCLDEGFAGNDQLKANAVQIFKTKGITSFKTV